MRAADLRGRLRDGAEAESREDRGCSGCALAGPDGRFACLRLCDELIGGAGQEPRADWWSRPPLRSQRTVPTAAGHRLRSRVGPCCSCAWPRHRPAWPGLGLRAKAPLPPGSFPGP